MSHLLTLPAKVLFDTGFGISFIVSLAHLWPCSSCSYG